MDEDKSIMWKYRNAIREMIKDENEIRNQRTNWFLVIQGFLIAGVCQLPDSHFLLKIFISLVGVITTVSFWQAAWRSTLATTYALCWWKTIKKKTDDIIPPVSLITRDILEKKRDDSLPGEQIYDRMMEEMDKWTKWRADSRNKWDRLLPYKLLPYVFFLFWIVNILCLWQGWYEPAETNEDMSIIFVKYYKYISL